MLTEHRNLFTENVLANYDESVNKEEKDDILAFFDGDAASD